MVLCHPVLPLCAVEIKIDIYIFAAALHVCEKVTVCILFLADQMFGLLTTVLRSSHSSWSSSTLRVQCMARRLKHNRRKEEYISFSGDLLYGIQPVSLALKAGRRNVHRIFYNPGSPRAAQVAKAATEVETVELRREALDSMCRQVDRYKEHHVHQGIVADVSRLHHIPYDFTRTQPWINAESLPPDKAYVETNINRPKLWLLLCSVRDPMNLGTILRTSHFLGVDRVLVTGARCELSCIVSKASVGALEVTPLWAVKRPVELLRSLVESGWSTLAACLGDGKGPSSSPVSSFHLSTLGSTIVVLGSEGEGIPAEVLAECNFGVHIPAGPGVEAEVDSLNVSVATGILLHSLVSSPLTLLK